MRAMLLEMLSRKTSGISLEAHGAGPDGGAAGAHVGNTQWQAEMV